jgi:hypothetical protein
VTPEQRLDRLERIAKLFASAGLRERRRRLETEDKINILFDAQIANEERFANVSQSLDRLALAQIHSDRRLDALIDIVREGRIGRSPENS